MKCGLPMAWTSPAARDSVRRHLHQSNPLRCLHPSRLSDFDLWVARVLQQRRKPADLELRAAINQHIGLAKFDDETGPRIDEMRILGRLGEDGDVDIVTADLAGDRGIIGQSRDNVDFGLDSQSRRLGKGRH